MTRTVPPSADDANPSPWLSDISPKHRVWDTTKAHADTVAAIYATAPDLAHYGPKLRGCSETLILSEHVTPDGVDFHAHSAKCRGRHCPICQRARTLRLVHEMETALVPLTAKYPKHRWLFLTLTVRNCPLRELRGTLQEMGKAWQRLIKRKEFGIVTGWLRSTEVTQGENGPMQAHPHFHALLFVPPSYFTRDYIKHEAWVSLWQKCARLDYAPNVHVQAVKTLEGGLLEVVKTAAYSVKAEAIEAAPEWFLEYHRQAHKLRFFATGGAVKEHLTISEETADDIIEESPSEATTETGRKILLGWERPVRRYRKRAERKGDATGA